MGDVDHDRTRQQIADPAIPVAPPIGVPELARPGDALRSLPAEARERGTRLVSARAMQARLFSVYDAAAAAEEALALVQEQLTLTLNRSYYEAEEIETTAAQLDALLTPSAPSSNPMPTSAVTPGLEAADTEEPEGTGFPGDVEGVEGRNGADPRSDADTDTAGESAAG
jgi:hypothetical protein